MGCGCGGKTRERWLVTLATGTVITKWSQAQAEALVKRHLGAKAVKADK